MDYLVVAVVCLAFGFLAGRTVERRERMTAKRDLRRDTPVQQLRDAEVLKQRGDPDSAPLQADPSATQGPVPEAVAQNPDESFAVADVDATDGETATPRPEVRIDEATLAAQGLRITEWRVSDESASEYWALTFSIRDDPRRPPIVRQFPLRVVSRGADDQLLHVRDTWLFGDNFVGPSREATVRALFSKTHDSEPTRAVEVSMNGVPSRETDGWADRTSLVRRQA